MNFRKVRKSRKLQKGTRILKKANKKLATLNLGSIFFSLKVSNEDGLLELILAQLKAGYNSSPTE